MKYELLRQTSDHYDAGLWAELDDLYKGGYAILDNAKAYIPQLAGEHESRYKERLKAAAYINYFAKIVNRFASELFAKDLRIVPAADANNPNTPGSEPILDGYWEDFSSNADRKGTSFSRIMRNVLTTALIKRVGYIVCDFPNETQEFATRQEEDEAGAASGYCLELPPEQLIDWKLDDRGAFAWAILHREICERAAPEAKRETRTLEWKIWRATDAGASWELYRSRPLKAKEQLNQDEDIPLVASGLTAFRRVPIIRLELPDGLWVGNHIGPMAREHFERRSTMNAAENRSMFAVPVVKLGPEMSAVGQPMPAEVQQNPTRGQNPIERFQAAGFVVIGSGDDITFAEPTGGAYALVDKQLQSLVDEMHRVVQQMADSVANTSQALGRSGDSKQEDRYSTEVVLEALGALTSEASRGVYTCISEARDEQTIWQPHGLTAFKSDDRRTMMSEATQVDQMQIPSPTFRKLYKTRLALKILGNVEPEQASVIENEIKQGSIAEEDLRVAQHNYQYDQFANPEANQPPAAKS